MDSFCNGYYLISMYVRELSLSLLTTHYPTHSTVNGTTKINEKKKVYKSAKTPHAHVRFWQDATSHPHWVHLFHVHAQLNCLIGMSDNSCKYFVGTLTGNRILQSSMYKADGRGKQQRKDPQGVLEIAAILWHQEKPRIHKYRHTNRWPAKLTALYMHQPFVTTPPTFRE